ncbi:MAG: hypothetical protein GTO31_01865, partial [Xanthomonadales bacterium]|nr:hypothetical protein [Xanthomonadales bacterium]
DAAERSRPLALNLAAELNLDPAEAEEAVALAADALVNARFRSLWDAAERADAEVSFCVPLSELAQLGLGEEGFLEGSMDLV